MQTNFDIKRSKYQFLIFSVLYFTLVFLSVSRPVQSQDLDIAQYFKQNCNSCHWIGGGSLIGPDLKNVSLRKDKDWLIRFILDPKAMLDAQDPYAMKLKAEAKGAIMINVPGMNRSIAEKLLNFIDAESKLDSSMFAGKIIDLGPFSAEDAAKGEEIFSGKIALENAGPSCVTCHTVNIVGASLGGQLGPDLTTVYNRLQGRTALTAWLSAPPTSTMQSIFKEHQLNENEIHYLVTYFESASSVSNYNYDVFFVWMTVIFCGFGGSVMALVVFSGIWSNRFKSVRRLMVNKMKISS